MPHFPCLSSTKVGRKCLGDIISVVIVVVSACDTTLSAYYYSAPAVDISGSYANSLKELLCLGVSILLLLSRFLHPATVWCTVVLRDRETLSLMIAVFGSVCNFVVLVRWYEQEGNVYAWHINNNRTYVLVWEVKVIMCLVLSCFTLNFLEFSLMLLTKMRPQYRDLNPDLTASIRATSILHAV